MEQSSVSRQRSGFGAGGSRYKVPQQYGNRAAANAAKTGSVEKRPANSAAGPPPHTPSKISPSSQQQRGWTPAANGSGGGSSSNNNNNNNSGTSNSNSSSSSSNSNNAGGARRDSFSKPAQPRWNIAGSGSGSGSPSRDFGSGSGSRGNSPIWDDFGMDGESKSRRRFNIPLPSEFGKRGEAQVTRVDFVYDPPVQDCQFRPYVKLVDSNGCTVVNHREVKEKGPRADYKWLRGPKRLCSAPRCNNNATMQCVTCLKLRRPANGAYFCSPECLGKAWPLHKQDHVPPPEQQLSGKSGSDADSNQQDAHQQQQAWMPWRQSEPGVVSEGGVFESDDPKDLCCKYPAPITNEWKEIHRERWYTPAKDDVGCVLKFQVAVETGSMLPSNQPKMSPWWIADSLPVVAAPTQPPPRKSVFLKPSGNVAGQPFKVMCYNVLAEIYASKALYEYCPTWALDWDYRKQQLLRDILRHKSDIICLQEVQANHFEHWFRPNLVKAGYEGIFKRKTREHIGDDPNAIDGCAIFFRRERFVLTEQYSIAFNEAAKQHTHDPLALRRLIKGNVALVAVLEDHGPPPGELNAGSRRIKRRLCVANTHIYWDPEHADVKLWQTMVLCRELERLFGAPRNLPLVLCGDFNSMTDSSVYEFLSSQSVTPKHKVFNQDVARILPPPQQITHRIPLVSAYASIGEPKYTNYTGHFVGVLDYIWFTKSHLTVTSCLDVDEEKNLTKNTALPSPQYSSDHLPLVSVLDWLQDV